jgi:membrane fusion protein (multidrug efflux system)
VRVRVHERELSRINVGDEIEAKLPSSGQTAKGKVTFISPEIDPRTRNAEVVTRIPNPQRALRAGMFAEIRIKPKASAESLVIPTTSVAGTGEARYVFLINGERTKRQLVKVAPVDGEIVEVLEGLAEGQQIVREGLGRLSEGALVKVESAPTQAAGATP